MPELHEHSGADWEEMAKIYKQLTVGTSVKPIGVILDQLNALLPFSEATGIHDNGCGPGPIMSRLIKEYGSAIPDDCSLTCSDFSGAMIQQVEDTKSEAVKANPDSPWNRVETSVENAMDLKGIQDTSKSHVTAGWVYFMTPDPMKCLAESRRVLKTDGVLGASSWKGSEWLQLMNLVPQVRPDKQMPTIPEAWTSAEPMKAEFERAGFREVNSMEVEVEMSFDTYESFIDLLTRKMPHMIALLQDFSNEDTVKLKSLMLEQLKHLAPTEPGVLQGQALVAVGRK